MRYEGKSESDAAEAAARALGQPVSAIRYRIVRDERSFWGGRGGEIEVEEKVDSGQSGGEVDSRQSGQAVDNRQSTVDGGEVEGEEGEQIYRPPVEERRPRPAGGAEMEAVAPEAVGR